MLTGVPPRLPQREKGRSGLEFFGVFHMTISRTTLASRLVLSSVALGMTLVVAGCDVARNQVAFDRAGNFERDDLKRALAPRPLPKDDGSDIPALESVMASPDEVKQQWPLVSISVNQTVPLRDVLFELADQADIDIELDPQIRGAIIFTARNRPFDEVIDRIADLSGLRYKFKGDILRIEVDRPYVKTYKIDYLNIVRSAESSISASNSASSGSGGNGSEAGVNTTIENDFWADLSTNLDQILTSTDTYVGLATLADPEAQPRQAASRTPPAAPAAAGQDPYMAVAQQAMPQSGPPVLTVQVPTGAQDPAIPNPPASHSTNRQTGLVTVFASARQHEQISEYLTELRRNMTAQVLIEAKILEVSLNDEYSAGINWNDLDLIDITGSANIRFTDQLLNPGPSAVVGRLEIGDDVSLGVSALSEFGNVRALASPRLATTNNQMSILTVGQNRVFFELTADSERDDAGRDSVSVESEIRTVLEGVVMSVVPSIDLDKNRVTLSLKPSINRVIGTVPDPGVAISLATIASANPNLIDLLDQVSNEVPVTATQDIDSVIALQSGQVAILGGLMQDRVEGNEVGVPILADIPVLGALFKNHSDTINKTELVIFIKATIIPGSNLHDTDRELYNNFSLDRRPFRM